MNPRVSIVVPVYNAQDFVTETIESLLQQNYPHLEIIVIDDGSKDRSLAALEKFRDHVTLISQANQGQASTLNRGWSLASGDLLGYLSADDKLRPGCLHKLAAYLEQRVATIAVYPDYDLIDVKSRLLRTVQAPQFDWERCVRFLECAPGPGLLFRRHVINAVGGWRTDLKQMPDFDFLLRLGTLGRIERLPEVLAEFRIHEGSQTFAASSIEKAEEPVKVMRDFFAGDHLTSRELQWRDQAEAFAHVLAARLHFRSQRWSEGMAHLAATFVHDPGTLLHQKTARLIANALFGQALHRGRQRLLQATERSRKSA